MLPIITWSSLLIISQCGRLSSELVGQRAGVTGRAGVAAINMGDARAGNPDGSAATHPNLEG